MVRLLIVDDEKIIREGIAASIDWDKLGITVADTAASGTEAYEKICAAPPDVLLTDIRMPGLDGLQLIRKVKEDRQCIKCVVLSGYAEFGYARQLMQDGVKHYLLKPTSIEEITVTMGEVLQELLEERQREEADQQMRKELSEWRAQHSGAAVTSVDRRDGDQTDVPAPVFSPAVQQLAQLAKQHFADEELSLLWIAKEKLYMNADYLGKLFAKETGQYFSNYVMQLRVERAMELIRTDCRLKNYELASLTGFGANAQYFIKIFKRIAGCTPGEYNKRAMRQ